MPTVTYMDFSQSVRSWEDLASLVDHFSRWNGHDWLFRGVSDEGHDLVPKIGRPTTRAVKPLASGRPGPVPYTLQAEKSVFWMFRNQARSHLHGGPANMLEWLALAQHYGLPTRLLDWTDSLLVAAWFAVEKAGAKKNGADAAIWVTSGAKPLDGEADVDPFSLRSPRVYRPAHFSGRIAAQGSVLMVCPTPTVPVRLQWSRKIVIDRKIEFTLKKRLNACGVNRRLLFPDLQGLAEHLSWLHKHDYLSGFRDLGDRDAMPDRDEDT